MAAEDLLARRLGEVLRDGGAAVWGFADVDGLAHGRFSRYPRAVSFASAMDPTVMAGVVRGPTAAYADLYAWANQLLDTLSRRVALAILEAGHEARWVPASKRTDPAGLRGEFPHKTAATRCGMGWVGRNAQLVTRLLGPWIRLGTVLTDAPLPVSAPVTGSSCGQCTACVEACPAGALRGTLWRPGLPREELLDATRCDQWKKTHYPQFHGGHNCGICAAVCPFGQKTVRRGSR